MYLRNSLGYFHIHTFDLDDQNRRGPFLKSILQESMFSENMAIQVFRQKNIWRRNLICYTTTISIKTNSYVWDDTLF